ncbi:hypothetical protein [Mariniphaga sp.]|uniref:hypothetical protein n=1 Tax=Mariniphaga sp. TaxID=1954475 RepID=UPI0035638AA6
MENLLDGLLLYEITLLILGVILFLILSIGLLYYIIKKEQIAKLLFFFFIPIVMIGYPSITQITISNDKIELTKWQNQVLDDPEDSVAVQKMQELTTKLEKRASTTEDLVQVSTSNLLLGNNEKAENLADKALEKDKTSTAALNIKQMARVQESIKNKPVLENAAPVEKEATPAREETNLSAIPYNQANTITDSPAVTAIPQTGNDTAKLMVNPQTKDLQQMEVTNDLTKVKSFLIKRSIKNINTTRESAK